MLSPEFNDKGKYFTDIISKAIVPTIIQTTSHRIEGNVHIRPDGRLKDELDRDELFLAVTDARIFNSDGSILYESEFLGISRQQIIWIKPNGETINPGEPK